MPSKLDMVGQKHNRLAVISESPSKRRGRPCWVCRCDCGKTVTATSTELRSGTKKSCGCATVDAAKARTTHNKSHSPEYHTWDNMVRRCTKANHPEWKMYGGLGVTVHSEWVSDFAAFYAHIGDRPSDRHSLDRFPDPFGNYEPGNVRWATWAEQARNKRTTKVYSLGVRCMVLTDWATFLGMSPQTLRHRLIKKNWTPVEAFTTPSGSPRGAYPTLVNGISV